MNQLIYAVLSAEDAKLVANILEETAKAELSAINQRVFDQNRPPAHTCTEIVQRINDTILSIRAGVPGKIWACAPNVKFTPIEYYGAKVEKIIKSICERLNANESALIPYKETYQLVSSFDEFLDLNPKTTSGYCFTQNRCKKS